MYYVIVDTFASYMNYIQFVSVLLVLWFKNLRSLDLMFIGFNMTENSLKTREARLTAYHRIIEAFKFAYAQRSELGDPEFVSNVTQVWNMFPCYWKPTELKFLNFIFRVFRLLIYSSDSCIDWMSLNRIWKLPFIDHERSMVKGVPDYVCVAGHKDLNICRLCW